MYGDGGGVTVAYYRITPFNLFFFYLRGRSKWGSVCTYFRPFDLRVVLVEVSEAHVSFLVSVVASPTVSISVAH